MPRKYAEQKSEEQKNVYRHTVYAELGDFADGWSCKPAQIATPWQGGFGAKLTLKRKDFQLSILR